MPNVHTREVRAASKAVSGCTAPGQPLVLPLNLARRAEELGEVVYGSVETHFSCAQQQLLQNLHQELFIHNLAGGSTCSCEQPGCTSASQRVKDTPDVKNLSQGIECEILLV